MFIANTSSFDKQREDGEERFLTGRRDNRLRELGGGKVGLGRVVERGL